LQNSKYNIIKIAISSDRKYFLVYLLLYLGFKVLFLALFQKYGPKTK